MCVWIGRLRNLTAAEIVGQVVHAKQCVGDYDTASRCDEAVPIGIPPPRRIKSIVLMGMGITIFPCLSIPFIPFISFLRRAVDELAKCEASPFVHDVSGRAEIWQEERHP